MTFALPAGMLIDMCIGRLRHLVPIAPELAPLVERLQVIGDTPTTLASGDREHHMVDRLQGVLARVEVKLHAAAKAGDRAQIAALSALVMTASNDLDEAAERALFQQLEQRGCR